MSHESKIDQIMRYLQGLPNDAFARLQYLQPENGCFNSCSFCSQEAGANVWQLDRESLENFMVALGRVARNRDIKIASGRKSHRTGVIFPYLDNDCFSYPYLDTYLHQAEKSLGVKVRVATVGFSRHNQELQEMHTRIVRDYGYVFAGIRISFTPYTAGYATTLSTKLSRDEYEQDVANTLLTYHPVFERLGFGKNTACVEIRFHPEIRITEVKEIMLEGHHVIATGPHVLVSCLKTEGVPLKIAKIIRVINGTPEYDENPRSYWLCTDQELVASFGIEGVAESILVGDKRVQRKTGEVPLYKFENKDGPYYAVSPDFRSDGQFYALHIYPKNNIRLSSGYNNASRHLLNALLRIKSQLGYARRDSFESANWEDVQLVVDKLNEQVDKLSLVDAYSALHIQRHVIPLVESYIRVLKLSGYPAGTFFNPHFTVDTGQIVNQGRAKKHFQGLVTVDDEPFTPREARAYGDDQSVSAQRGKVWRIVPVTLSTGDLALDRQVGGKAIISRDVGGIAIHEVSEHTLRPVDARTAKPLRRYFVPGLEIVVQRRRDSWSKHLLPGTLKE